MLTQMMETSNALQNKSIPERTIYLKLASIYQSSTDYLFMSPEELYDVTGLGSIHYWSELLNMQDTKNFLKGQMAAISQIAQRKSFKALLESALNGNHQASKQIQELSGVLNQQDSNRVVVLHRIPRPEVSNEEQKQSNG